MGCDLARSRERLHHIKTRGLGDHHGQSQSALQVSGVGSRGNHRITPLGLQALADVGHGLLKPQLYGLDGCAVVIFQRDIAKKIEQP